MRIGVVGGGLAGCLTALDYAERGHAVVLFEQEPRLLSRASTANEGKIHLGYCYAADPGFRTAERLIEDALLFRPILERWMTAAEFDACLCDPFYYTVPAASALPVDRITAHFGRVEAHARERAQSLGRGYLGQSEILPFERRPDSGASGDPVFLTSERGVWPTGIARRIEERVLVHPRIEPRLGASVRTLQPAGTKWRAALSAGEAEGPFDIVVNAAWAERRALDRRSGFPAAGSWYTRYKFGVILRQASLHLPGTIPPNTTATSGPFGDCVYYGGDDSLYCSWYPVGMVHATTGEDVSRRPTLPAEPEQLIRRTFEGCAAFAPALGGLAALPALPPASLVGDYIVAKGATDIHDPQSQLHRRSDHGVSELGPGYWTIETGKYTSAPRCAAECVALSLGGR